MSESPPIGSSSASSASAVAKLETGIPGFDFISRGGLPKGRLTLLSGPAGSGKTIFASHFLAQGIERGESAVFVTFEEPAASMRRNLPSLGWDVEAWEEAGLWRFVDASLSPEQESLVSGSFDLGALLARIEYAVEESGARRVALDSLAALFLQFQDPTLVRRELLRISFSLRALGVTSLLTAELVDEASSSSRFGVEEYVADCVVLLRNVLDREQRRRTVEVFKMRGSSHHQGEVPFTIESGRGVVVLPLAEVELTQESGGSRLTSGNEVLDEMCGGGFLRDSIVLVSGATGTGKTLISSVFAAGGAKAGERVLFYGFEESRPQLFRNAAAWGHDFEALEEQGLLRVRSRYPETATLEQHLLEMREDVDQFKPDRLVVDSLSALERIASARSFREFLLTFTGYLKNRRVTGLMTSTAPGLVGSSTVTAANISTSTDTIVVLRYVETAGRVRRVLMVLKMRGSLHDKTIREFTIDTEGLHVEGPFTDADGILSGLPRPLTS